MGPRFLTQEFPALIPQTWPSDGLFYHWIVREHLQWVPEGHRHRQPMISFLPLESFSFSIISHKQTM